MRAGAVLVVPGAVPVEFERARRWMLERACAAATSVSDVVRQSGGTPAEIGAAFEEAGGPVLLLAADVPRVGDDHLRWALTDLAEGAGASLGPTFDGGWYLVGLARPGVRLPPPAGPAAALLATAAEEEIEAGLLRMERALRSAEDARALLADPLVSADLRRILDG